MVAVTREFAERIASLAQLLLSDDDPGQKLRQLAELALAVIPGSDAAGVVAAGESSWSFAASAGPVADMHEIQLQTGDGPVAEVLRYGEARRIDDAAAADRWPAVCATMATEDLRSCLVLPCAPTGGPPDVAFKRLSAMSQHSNRKVRDIAAGLVEGRIDREQSGVG